MQNVVGPTFVAMATKFGLGAEIQSPTGLFVFSFVRYIHRHSPGVVEIIHTRQEFTIVAGSSSSSSSSSSSKFIVRLLENGHRCITESQTLYKINLKPNSQ